MLKAKIEALEEVSEAIREHYLPGKSGGFVLDTEDATELRNALTAERQHRKTADSRARELEEQLRIVRGEPKPPTEGDAEQRQEKRVNDKLAEVDTKYRGMIDSRAATIRKIMTDVEARALAVRLADRGSRDALTRLLRDRISVDVNENGDGVARFKSASGADISAADLEAEFRAAPEYAPLILGASAGEKAAHARRVAETLARKHG